MNRKQTYNTLFVPTLVDTEGLRHIIPGKDYPAYCEATGEQHAPATHRAASLCQRCVQKYLRALLDIRMEDYGI